MRAPIMSLILWYSFAIYAPDYAFSENRGNLKVGQETLDVLYTPGHCPGEVSLSCVKQNTDCS